MCTQFYPKFLLSFFISIFLLIIYSHHPVNTTYLYLKYGSTTDGAAYLYLNEDWGHPFIVNKDFEGIGLIRFGPIDQDIRMIRIDPINNKNSNVEIEEIYLENSVKRIYDYDIYNKNIWDIQFVKKIEKMKSGGILLEANKISPITIQNNQVVKLVDRPSYKVFKFIDNILSRDKIIINIILVNMILSVVLFLNKKYSFIYSLILAFFWIFANIELYALVYNSINYTYVASLPIGAGGYNGINVKSNLYAYISVIIFNLFLYKLIKIK